MILKIMPSPRILKKSNLFDLKFFNRSLKIFLRLILFNAEIKSLYTPVISAIVPPETPGIKSAIPINIPFNKIIG